MSAQHTTHAHHAAAGHDDHHHADDGPHSTFSGYMIGFVLSVICTIGMVVLFASGMYDRLVNMSM